MQMNPSEQFAAHVAEARYEDLPDPIVARAKERLADSVGVMSAGARGVGIPGMVDMAMSKQAKPPCRRKMPRISAPP